jgi:uncharacterized RDD family membrane protein YckC
MTAIPGGALCPACAPAYAQTQAAAPPPAAIVSGGRRYGGFWIRFAARLIDGLIIGVVMGVLIVPLVLLTGGLGALIANNPENIDPAAALSFLPILGIFCVALLAPLVYEVYFVSTRGATLGKMALGLVIIRANGAPVSTGLAVGRYFAQILSQWTLYIGYIIAGFDVEKRALHDHICGTRVVYAK